MSNNPFMDRSSLSRVPVTELKIGMFVAELDRPWLETPFLIQGFTVKSRAEIRKLTEYCRFVYVDAGGRKWGAKANPFKDPFKSRMQGEASQQGLLDQRHRNKRTGSEFNLVETVSKRESHRSTATVYEEHAKARDTYGAAKQSIKGILDQIRVAGLVDSKSAKATVTQCVKSILRNPDAMMWMTRIKNINEYTAEHCLNVSILAIAFGRHLRLPETELEKLGLCGLLHDVGKVKVPDEILNKPETLTPEEFEIMKQHATIGRDMLKKSANVYQYVIDAAYNHHEQIDGKGYPRQLLASELSDFTRIISIVDAFDAMTSDRCYATSRSNLDALKEIYKNRGKQFDEELALEFISVVGPYPPGTIVELKNGCIGIVLQSEAKKRHLPSIELVRDEQGQDIEPRVVNLWDVESGRLDKSHLIQKVLKNGERGIKLQDFPVRLMLNPDANKPSADDEDLLLDD